MRQHKKIFNIFYVRGQKAFQENNPKDIAEVVGDSGYELTDLDAAIEGWEKGWKDASKGKIS